VARVPVGVVLKRQLPEGGLQLRGRASSTDCQNFVVVTLRGRGRHPCSTLCRNEAFCLGGHLPILNIMQVASPAMTSTLGRLLRLLRPSAPRVVGAVLAAAASAAAAAAYAWRIGPLLRGSSSARRCRWGRSTRR